MPSILDIYHEHKSCLGDPHTGEFCHEDWWIVCEFAQITKAKHILEIGYNRGAFTTAVLLWTDAYITSVDLIEKNQSYDYLRLIFGERHNFIKLDSANLRYKKELVGIFDAAYVDGRHDKTGCQDDILSCFELEIPFLLFDDWNSRGDLGVKEAIKENSGRLKLLREYQNKALFFALPDLD